MVEDVEEYWRQHVHNLEDKYSVGIEAISAVSAYVDLDSDDPRRGQINARIYFHDEDIHLTVHETVEIDTAGMPHRRRYAYQLMVHGVRARRWHFDPDLPEHLQHHIDDELAGVAHEPDTRRSLSVVIKDCWDEIESLEQAIRDGDIQAEQ